MKLTGTTYGELLAPAMLIHFQDEADAYFVALVERGMELRAEYGEDPMMREEMADIQRQNLGYYTGYCDQETRDRVFRLFRCEHPIFGTVTPTAEEAFEAGRKIGEQVKNGVAIDDAIAAVRDVRPSQPMVVRRFARDRDV